MVEKIGSIMYDTENSEKLGTYTKGAYGDPTGYEETLYRNKRRLYFFHGIGGAESRYPSESIVTVTAADAKEWLKAHGE